MLEIGLNLILIFTLLIPFGFLIGITISRSFVYNKQIENSKKTYPEKIFEKIEGFIFRVCSINPEEEMTGRQYLGTLLLLNLIIGTIIFFIATIQITSHCFTLQKPIDISSIFHLTCSYLTNTDQEHLNADIDLPMITRFFIIPFLMLISSGTGISISIMFIRAITKGIIGNFYVDFIKSFIRIVFPICFLISILFVLLGMPNTIPKLISYETLESAKETLTIGPIAALEAIILFGQEGGSIYSSNASHPFSNPTYLTNLLQMVFMTVIPVALIFTLGFCLNNNRQSMVLLLALFSIIIFEVVLSCMLELRGNPMHNAILGTDFPNWMGKETRFGIITSSIYSILASNVSGATNSALDGYHPISIGMMIFNLADQGILGGQGLGPIYALNYFIYTVIFIGFMTGKSPEMFGRRIEKREIILSSLILLLNPLVISILIPLAINIQHLSFISFHDHIHYYTRILYEFLSAASNNGSGLEGLTDNIPILNYTSGATMLLGWFGPITLSCGIASGLAKKKSRLKSPEIFKTDTILFSFLYLFMTVSLTLLTYFPFIVLGPISEVLTKG